LEFYTSTESPRIHVLQFDPGAYLLEGLKDFIVASGVRNGAVVSGIGTLNQCTMHMVTTTTFPPVEVFPSWEDTALELTSMQGIIADGVPHIHMNVSTKETAVGGHLEPGCQVLYLAEITVLEFSGLPLTRVPNEQQILQLVPALPSEAVK
jgi:predicted DNA-binding protein with PD1-like motif